MFIKSNMDVAVTYNKGAHSIVLAPNVITEVDETIVSKQELKNCYNDRITFIDPKYIEPETPVKEDNGDENNAPDEVKTENDNTKTDDAEASDLANTGDEEVDAFLNGETDKLPEGTEEITEKEAEELVNKTDLPEKCKECYADGKTPADEDCKNCEIKNAENAEVKEPADEDCKNCEIKNAENAEVKEPAKEKTNKKG